MAIEKVPDLSSAGVSEGKSCSIANIMNTVIVKEALSKLGKVLSTHLHQGQCAITFKSILI